MNKIYYLLSALILLTGCKLKPKLYSDLTTENAYNDESGIDAALTGVYADLGPYPGDGWQYYNGYLIMTTDYACDMGYSTAAGAPLKMSNFTYDASNLYITSNWRYMYKVIADANMLLSKIGAVKMDENKKNLVIAQTKFIRALTYSDLVDGWGSVPLITVPQNPMNTFDYPLAPQASIDSLIIVDCKYALSILPEQWLDPKVSRATSGAAATLLGKVYMRSHDYKNAKTYIDKVLEERSRGIYTLNPDFKDEWAESNRIDAGMIFGILHEPAQNGGEITNHFGPIDNREVPDRWQYYAVSLYFWHKYDDADPRKQFFYYNYEGLAPRDNTTTHGFYYMAPAVGQTAPPNDTTKLLPNIATRKYSYKMMSNSYYDGRTIQIFRIADVILCKAEIENALSGPTAALPYINEIRGRAHAPLLGSSAVYPIPASKDEMNERILAERGFELVFEYKRRADLKRFGKFVEASTNYLQSLNLPHTPTVTPAMALFPYPKDDAEKNSAMAAANQSRLPQ